MNDSSENKRMIPLLLVLLTVAAALLRVQNIFSGLEYDEIWTLENFASMPLFKLFTELALPNNQPLNSCWVKFAVYSELPVWSIRIHSLIASILTLPLAGFISYHLAGKKISAAFACMAFLALSSPDIAYATLARGYALQVFFLTLFGAGLTAAAFCCPQGKIKKFLPELAVFLGGAGAGLTLPTSVVYLAGITLAAFLIKPELPRRSLLFVLIAGVALTAFFCLFNLQQLNAARIWGSKITSFADFCNFLSDTSKHVIAPVALLVSCIALRSRPRQTLPLLFILLLPLLSAVLTNAGPPRTYIPFGTVLAISAGCGASIIIQKLKKSLAVPVCLALTVFLAGEYALRRQLWYTPDSREIFKQTAQLPSTSLVVHRATSGYPLAWNNQPEIYSDFVKRLLEHSTELIMFDGPGRINGNDRQNNEAVITIPAQGTEIKSGVLNYRKYALEELSTPPGQEENVLIVLRPMPENMLNFYFSLLNTPKSSWLKLNPWLNRHLNLQDGTYRYALLAGKVNSVSFDWNPFLNSNGSISVYRFGK